MIAWNRLRIHIPNDVEDENQDDDENDDENDQTTTEFSFWMQKWCG